MTPIGLVAEPCVEAGRQEVVGVEYDERAAPAPGFGAGDEGSREPTPPEGLRHPHGLQLAAAAPDDAGDARADPTLVVADEDSELLLATHAGGGDRG